ncbi:hypothetical protein ASD99_17320 [Mesorhizobium sp. Root695]|nr:hypothetical protein ASD12_10420 [Mesorhizobium sp. Root102]KRB33571.1 hypothetical protein ASD99_17320 [Mesorhizobium sp. Root695]
MSFLRPRQKPKKAYPNSDRFGEDGRRLYSAYASADRKQPGKSRKRRHLALILGGSTVAAAVGVLMYLISAG